MLLFSFMEIIFSLFLVDTPGCIHVDSSVYRMPILQEFNFTTHRLVFSRGRDRGLHLSLKYDHTLNDILNTF